MKKKLMGLIRLNQVAVAPLLQLRLILLRGNSDEVSIGFLLVVTLGVGMWAAYGFAKGDLFLAVPNLTAVLCAGATALVAWRFRRLPEPTA